MKKSVYLRFESRSYYVECIATFFGKPLEAVCLPILTKMARESCQSPKSRDVQITIFKISD